MEPTIPYRVIAIPSKVADLVRSTMKSPRYGHPAHTEVAAGHGPCRHCLRDFRVGQESRILFTYDPFFGLESLPLPGPIFIHAEPCEQFSETGGFPKDARHHRLTLAAYGEKRRLIAEDHIENGDVEPAIQELLTAGPVKYIHVRDTEAGCYDFRIEPMLIDQVSPQSQRNTEKNQ